MTLWFNVEYRRSNGNLHIRLQGEFNGMCAWELIKTIRQRYTGSGRVFVGTAGLTDVQDSGVELFKAHMTQKNMPRGGLYFKGIKGFTIAPDGARVVICKPAERANSTATHAGAEARTRFFQHRAKPVSGRVDL